MKFNGKATKDSQKKTQSFPSKETKKKKKKPQSFLKVKVNANYFAKAKHLFVTSHSKSKNYKIQISHSAYDRNCV